MYKLLKAIIALIVLLFTSEVQAQNSTDYTVNLSQGKLIIEDVNDLVIKGYSGSEIKFSSEDIDEEVSERSVGLRLINNSGLSDNTGLGISVTQETSTVIATQIAGSNEDRLLTVFVPTNVNVYVSHSSSQADEIEIEDLKSELEITTNYHDINFENVTGPMAIKTVYGSIEGHFSEVNQTGSISLYSVYELVDVTIPKSSKANLNLSASYGDVYSNMNIDIKANRAKKKSNKNSCNTSCNSQYGTDISGSINGGGVDFTLKSSYENIYLRSK